MREVFCRGASRDPAKVALVCRGKRFSYDRLNWLVLQATAALQARGFRPGDRVAIAAQNSLELVVLFYALASAGCVTVWINPSYRGDELLFPLANTGARGLLVEDTEPLLGQVLRGKAEGKLEGLERLLIRESESERTTGRDGSSAALAARDPAIETWQSFLSAGDPALARPVAVPEDNYVAIIHTSGATGVPKGAPASHGQVVAQSFHYARALRSGPEDVFLGALPMFHSFGFICLLVQVFQLGATLITMPEWNTGQALELIGTERVTVHPAAPTHYLLEMAHPEFQQADLSSLRAGLISGYTPPRELFATIEQQYADMVFSNFWGSSETGPGLFSPFVAPREKRYYTVGHPVVGEQVRVVDAETGEVHPPGEAGELQVRGPNVIREYWNNPEETRRHLEPDGWYHTGDLASVDEDGYVTIVGRLKDQINRGGLKITPRDLEAEIACYPGVDQVCVIGIPNPVLGDSICACVIPERDCHVDLTELRQFLAPRVARNHLPDELCLLEQFPMLSGGVKIDKYGAAGLRAVVLARRDRQTARPGRRGGAP